MTNERLRRAIVVEAARLMYSRNQTEYYRAKLKAAKRLCKGWVKPAELPTNAEIRDEIQRMAYLFEGPSRFDRLREMRIEALRVMRLLARYRPKIIGSTFTGHIRHGSDIDIHVFAASTEGIESSLEAEVFGCGVDLVVLGFSLGEEAVSELVLGLGGIGESVVSDVLSESSLELGGVVEDGSLKNGGEHI